MSAAAKPGFQVGGPLTPEDYRNLEQRWISRKYADAAQLRRVDSLEGRDVVGFKSGDMSGIAIPFYTPGGAGPVAHRIRRDHPDFTMDADGTLEEERKYIGEVGRPNRAYFPPNVTPDMLQKASIPILVIEGEFKALARLAWPIMTLTSRDLLRSESQASGAGKAQSEKKSTGMGIGAM